MRRRTQKKEPAVRRATHVRGFVLRLAIVATLPAISTCGIEDLCTPQRASYGFLSRGDCVFTRSSVFQGHEWLTVLANGDLGPGQRFADGSIRSIAEGNRRVDWPKEVLVHMNTSVLAYISALNAYTGVPSRQSGHFLLDDRNTSAEAVSEAQALLRSLSWEAVASAVSDPERTWVAIGKANHLLQDSFSEAHAKRDVSNAAFPACVTKVKAYIERAAGFDTADIEYHGDDAVVIDEDDDDDDDDRGAAGQSVFKEGIGHATSQDAIYRKGRDCLSPESAAAVEGCLNDSARRARGATREYLRVMNDLLARFGGTDASADLSAVSALNGYVATYLSMCP